MEDKFCSSRSLVGHVFLPFENSWTYSVYLTLYFLGMGEEDIDLRTVV